MNAYYVAGLFYSDELYHYGVKGMRWGVRKYMNPDGTLTAEGKQRYGTSQGVGKYANNNSLIRQLATGERFYGVKQVSDEHEQALKSKLDKLGNSDSKKRERLQKQYDQQREANTARNRYISNQSTGKLLAQRILFGQYGAAQYRNDRAEGDTRYSAFKSAKAIKERFEDPGYVDWYFARAALRR